MKELHLTIEGMSCGHCVRAVSEAVKGIDGVEVDTVEIGSATLRIDPEKASVGEIIDSIMDAGYEAQEAGS
jgi:copper chaperone